MAEEPVGEGFTVRDRRGRAGSEGGATPPPAPPRGQAPGGAGTPTAEPATGGSPPAGAATRSLTGLFVMLASFAAAAMGEVADASGEVHLDPEQAAELIDLLMLLREKTESHRTPEETQVLEEIIYDLQVRWVDAQRRFGR